MKKLMEVTPSSLKTSALKENLFNKSWNASLLDTGALIDLNSSKVTDTRGDYIHDVNASDEEKKVKITCASAQYIEKVSDAYHKRTGKDISNITDAIIEVGTVDSYNSSKGISADTLFEIPPYIPNNAVYYSLNSHIEGMLGYRKTNANDNPLSRPISLLSKVSYLDRVPKAHTIYPSYKKGTVDTSDNASLEEVLHNAYISKGAFNDKSDAQGYSIDILNGYDGVRPSTSRIHNCLLFNEGKFDWVDNLSVNSSKVTKLARTPFAVDNCKDGLKVHIDSASILSSEPVELLRFSQSVTPSKTYYLSFYARMDGGLFNNSADGSLCDYDNICFIDVTGATPVSSVYVTGNWKRYLFKVSNASTITIQFKGKLTNSIPSRSMGLTASNLDIFLGGLLLEENTVSNYDARGVSYFGEWVKNGNWVNVKDTKIKEDDIVYINGTPMQYIRYDDNPSENYWQEVQSLTYPLTLELLPGDNCLSSPWMLSYHRYTFGDSSSANDFHYDRLGNLCWGFCNGKFVYGITNTQGGIPQFTEGLSVADLGVYNSWINLCLVFANSKVTFMMASSTSMEGHASDEPHTYITLGEINIDNTEIIEVPHFLGYNEAYNSDNYVTLVDNYIGDATADNLLRDMSEFIDTNSDDEHYSMFNLVLGLRSPVLYKNYEDGKIKGVMTIGSDTFRDLIFLPYSEGTDVVEEAHRILSRRFTVTKDNGVATWFNSHKVIGDGDRSQKSHSAIIATNLFEEVPSLINR